MTLRSARKVVSLHICTYQPHHHAFTITLPIPYCCHTQSSYIASRSILPPELYTTPVLPPPPPPPARPTTADSETWTGEPQCQKSVYMCYNTCICYYTSCYLFSYILVQLFRPKGVAPGNFIASFLAIIIYFSLYTPSPSPFSLPPSPSPTLSHSISSHPLHFPFHSHPLLTELDICCTLSLEDQYFTSQVFSSKPPNSNGPPSYVM